MSIIFVLSIHYPIYENKNLWLPTVVLESRIQALAKVGLDRALKQQGEFSFSPKLGYFDQKLG